MTARRLRSLCAIADHGSLTAAADALSFTQPAVSQHLAALEAEVQVSDLVANEQRRVRLAGLAVSLVPSLTKDDTARDRSVRVLPLRDPSRRRVVAATMAGGRTTQATREMVAALARAGARISRASH